MTSRYALRDILPRQLALIDDVVAGRGAADIEASVAGRLLAGRVLADGGPVPAAESVR